MPWRYAATWWWALLPLLTFSLATPLVFGYAAYRRRTLSDWLVAAGYTALLTVTWVRRATNPAADLPVLVILLAMVGATAHAILIRRRVFGNQAVSRP